MTVTLGQPAPATSAAPVPVELVWMRADGNRLGGMLQLGHLGPADSTTVDAFSDYDPADSWTLTRATPEAAARHFVDWLGLTGRPVALKIIDETRY